MKSALNQKLHRWALAALCGLWLTGVSLFAQEKSDEAGNSAPTNNAALAEAQSDPSESITKSLKRSRFTGGRHEDATVSLGGDAELKEGETTEAFVLINGNGTVNGKVRGAAVVVGGNVEVNGEVGAAVVAVMGKVKVGPNATVRGPVVSVGGKVDVAEGAKVAGPIVPIDFDAFGLPRVEPLRKWFVHCLLKLRPLAPQVGWVWIVAAVFFLVYLLVAVVLHKPVEACVAELKRRPVTTFFMGLLTKLLLPVVLLILAVTVIGLVVVPFVLAALFFGAIIGKVALLEYFGGAGLRATGAAEPVNPVIALLVGALLLTVLYMIPVLGLITFAVTGLWGLGVAVTTGFGSLKRESPEKPGASPGAAMTAAGPASLAPMPVAAVAGQTPQSFATDAPGTPDASTAAPASPAMPVAAVPEAFAYPRASFWERMGAAFLDIVIVGILSWFVGGLPLGLLVMLAYFAGMWAWKGTTVGGVVLGLKVVRLDGRPVTFAVALVRGLAAALSVIVLFLGFLWIAWDPDKQGWHDRIAGTVVIRLPRGTSLVLF